MVVGRAELEASLARLQAEVVDPRAGIHGPGSTAWQLERDSLIFLGGGRAVLLQLAHPFVAHAIRDHSRTRGDVIGRFQRTFRAVFAMSFGDLDHACRAARAIHGVHERVRGVLADDAGGFAPGTPYAGNDPDALRWVHATLIETVVVVHEAIHGLLYRDALGQPWVGGEAADDAPRLASPWTGRVLPVRPFLEAACVWFGLAHLWALASQAPAGTFPPGAARGRLVRAARGFAQGSLADRARPWWPAIRPDVLDAVDTLQKQVVGALVGAP